MKNLSILFFISSVSLWSSEPLKAEIPDIDDLYVPVGYDDNDIVEVVISGAFGDSCHQIGEPVVKVDPNAKSVLITPISFKEPGVACIQMVSPFSQVVRLGHLHKGDYTVRVANAALATKNLKVKEALAEQVDDFLYPPVDFAEVSNASSKSVLVMKGRYPLMKKGCMKMSDAIMTYQGDNILVVQPQAVVVDELPSGCESQYEEKFDLPFELKGKILVHVRASNGQSYNRVESLN